MINMVLNIDGYATLDQMEAFIRTARAAGVSSDTQISWDEDSYTFRIEADIKPVEYPQDSV